MTIKNSLTFQLPKDLEELIDRAAKRVDRSKSSFIRHHMKKASKEVLEK